MSSGPRATRLARRLARVARLLAARRGTAQQDARAAPSNRSRKYRVRAPLGPVIFGGFFMRWRQGRSYSLLPVGKRLELEELLSSKLTRERGGTVSSLNESRLGPFSLEEKLGGKKGSV